MENNDAKNDGGLRTQVNPETALEMLQQQGHQFIKQVVQTADNVYTAVGFHGANTSMIVGSDGLIIVDTLMGPESATNTFKEFRKYSDKPVKAIIYTHSHWDHTGGATVFAGENKPDVYAMSHFGAPAGVDNSVAPIMQPRQIRQFGRKLPDHEETNRGLAPAKTIDHDRGKGHIPPTHRIEGDSLKTTICGIDIEMYGAPGETDDALFVWLPKEKVLFSGDNFYHTFPNLYAIRGTPYRNVMIWSESVARMAAFEPEYLVPGHTIPISGRQEATLALKDYSEAIRSIYEQTVAGINEGKGPDLIAHEVALSDYLKGKPYLTEFYGKVPHAVRAIYAGLLGWYDGNPTRLNPLHPRTEADKMAEMVGGSTALAKKMQEALAAKDYQWALQLADHVQWLQDENKQLARSTKIAALRGLGAREYNAPSRNYYLSYANELEAGQLDQSWF